VELKIPVLFAVIAAASITASAQTLRADGAAVERYGRAAPVPGSALENRVTVVMTEPADVSRLGRASHQISLPLGVPVASRAPTVDEFGRNSPAPGLAGRYARGGEKHAALPDAESSRR
jgi:hypothetical protein